MIIVFSIFASPLILAKLYVLILVAERLMQKLAYLGSLLNPNYSLTYYCLVNFYGICILRSQTYVINIKII